jgi:hypothetical protein
MSDYNDKELWSANKPSGIQYTKHLRRYIQEISYDGHQGRLEKDWASAQSFLKEQLRVGLSCVHATALNL